MATRGNNNLVNPVDLSSFTAGGGNFDPNSVQFDLQQQIKGTGQAAEAQIAQNRDLLGNILASEVQGIRAGGDEFSQALDLEGTFLGLAADFASEGSQERRFAAVREQLLGDRARTGLFGATGDEAISIQGLGALDDLRRQDIGFARELASQSFFSPFRAQQQAFGRVGEESLFQTQFQNRNIERNLVGDRRIRKKQEKAARNAAIGKLAGQVLGAAFTGGASLAAGGGFFGGVQDSSGKTTQSGFLGALGGMFG